MNKDTASDSDPAQINPGDSGLTPHITTRVDVEQKHSVGVGVSNGQSHESPQFDELRDDVDVFVDLGLMILIFGRLSACGSVRSNIVTTTSSRSWA